MYSFNLNFEIGRSIESGKINVKQMKFNLETDLNRRSRIEIQKFL